MAELEVGTVSNTTASVEVETPERDYLALEAGKVNATVDAATGHNPFQRAQKPEYDAVQDFIDSVHTDRPNQLLERRSHLENAGVATDNVDKDIVKYSEDISGETEEELSFGTIRQKLALATEGKGKTEEELDRLAYSTSTAMALAPLQADGYLDIGGDIVGSMVPFNEAAQLQDIAAKMGWGDSMMDEAVHVVDPGRLLEQMQKGAAALPLEQRYLMQKDFLRIAQEETTNKQIIMQLHDAVFGQTDTRSAMTFWNTFDVVDGVAAVGVLAEGAKGIYKAAKATNTLRKIPTLEGLTMVNAVSKTPKMARDMDISPADVADLHTPGIHGTFGERLVGAPEDASAKITAMLDTQNARVKALDETMAREGLLTSERELEVMAQAELEIQNRGYPTEVVFTREDNGFTMAYKSEKYDPTTDTTDVVDVVEHRAFTVDDIGDVVADVKDEYTNKITQTDPNSRFKNRLNVELVQIPQHAMRSQGQSTAALKGMINDAYDGLSNKDLDELEGILLRGSKDQKEYDYEDLVSMGANPKVIQSYFGQRNVTHHIHSMKEQQLRESITARGGKVYISEEGDTTIKVFKEPRGAYSSYVDGDWQTNAVQIMDEGFPGYEKGALLDFDNPRDLTFEKVKEAEEAGFSLVRSFDPDSALRQGDNSTVWSFVKTDDIVDPADRKMLNRIPGYIPRSRTDSFFFVKGSKPSTMSGAKKGKTSQVTMAYADNHADAVAYAQKLAKETGEEYNVVFDRELNPAARDKDMAAVNGGMFSGKRKSTELPFVGKDETLGYEDSIEVLQRYVNNIARQVPMHLWRIGTEQRFLKRAKSLFPEAHIVNPHTVLDEVHKFKGTNPEGYKYLEDHYNQMASVNRIPTTDEQALYDKFKQIGIALEGTKFEFLSKHFYRASQKNFNPANKIRGLTFTHMLGMFNPSQMLVQGSGAFAAFAVNPVSAIKALPKTIGWQILDGVAHDPVQQRKVADWMRSNDLGDYADSYMVWVKSGFRESVTDTNADFATIFSNKPYTPNVLQRAAQNNDIFYKMGELAMSRASLATAVEWYKDAHKLSKVDIDDADALKVIYNRAEQYRLNMGRGNRSDFNKGMAAVPLQFQQVIAKYFEKVMPEKLGGTTEFTPMEKMRLFAIPAATFGASAVPLGEGIVEMYAGMFGIDLTRADPETVEAVRSGALGWMMSEGGMHVNFTDRMSLPSDIIGNLIEFASGGGGNVMETLAGPSGNLATRYTQAIQYIATAFDVVGEAESFTVDEVELLGHSIKEALMMLPSSTRNLQNYLPMLVESNPKRFIKDGKFMWESEDLNTQTRVLAAFGFQPTDQVDLYDALNLVRGGNHDTKLKFLKEDADVFTMMMSRSMNSNSPEDMKQRAKLSNAILRMYGSHGHAEMMAKIHKNLNTPKYNLAQLVSKVEEKIYNDVNQSHNVLNKLVASQNQSRFGEE